jgi:hypothetical protein
MYPETGPVREPEPKFPGSDGDWLGSEPRICALDGPGMTMNPKSIADGIHRILHNENLNFENIIFFI